VRKGFMLTVLVAVLAIGMIGCGGNDGLTAPDGTVYVSLTHLGLTRITGQYRSRITFGEGGTALPDDDLEIRAGFKGEEDIKSPLTAYVYFQFEDGKVYRNQAMVYGPFTGFRFKIESRFRLQDGLVQEAKSRPSQRIAYILKFSNGQQFNIFGFYIQDR
jgi:hypothetical protein